LFYKSPRDWDAQRIFLLLPGDSCKLAPESISFRFGKKKLFHPSNPKRNKNRIHKYFQNLNENKEMKCFVLQQYHGLGWPDKFVFLFLP